MARKKRKNKCEFSKQLLFVDYIVLGILLVYAAIWGASVDSVTIIVAWIAQIGLSSTAYYWKAKSDNRTKVPIKVIESLPEDIRSEIDMTQVITSIIQSE